VQADDGGVLRWVEEMKLPVIKKAGRPWKTYIDEGLVDLRSG